jgi:hypothetical protein
MSAPPDRVIAELPKSATETIRVALTTYQGRTGCDIRVYAVYRTTGEVGPTKAGLRVPLTMLPDLRAAIEEAERQARVAGLLGDGKAGAG